MKIYLKIIFLLSIMNNKKQIIQELSNIILQENTDYEYVPWYSSYKKDNNPKYDKYKGLNIEDFIHNDEITKMFLDIYKDNISDCKIKDEFYYECKDGDADLYFTKIPPIFSTYNILTKVTLVFSQITKIENLPPNITELDISHNKITKIENLPPNITELDISYNKITKIENLPEQLTKLNISNNKISKIENLPEKVVIYGLCIGHHS